jgi:hypothetical protein
MCDIGDPAMVQGLDPALVATGVLLIRQKVEDVIDRVKTSAEPLPVVVVGGGSVLLPDRLAGASVVIKPDHFAVANAIGAAIGQVGGEVDRIVSLANMTREEALKSARQEAIDKAVAAGADGSTVEVVEVEEVPLAYLPSSAVRIRMKAVGDLRVEVSNSAAS